MPTAATEVVQQPHRLPPEVLDALVEAAQPGLRHLDGGCLLHDTGRASWCGLTGKVKAILWESHHGSPVPPGSNLVRVCPTPTPGCIEPTHLVSVPRRQWGAYLGRPGGAWRPQAA
jgi:hypothetical protein